MLHGAGGVGDFAIFRFDVGYEWGSESLKSRLPEGASTPIMRNEARLKAGGLVGNGTMLKPELSKRLAAHKPLLYQSDVHAVVDAVLEVITAALVRGDRVELRGFGTFNVRERKARAGRNPRTGLVIFVERKVVPIFRMGREMRARLNKGEW
jgi:integration host factor subunit beta